MSLTTKNLNHWVLSLCVAASATACPGGGGTSDTETTGSTGGTATEPTSTSGTPDNCEGLGIAAIDEGACKPEASDYTPRTNNSADDTWPACVSDMGPYMLVGGTPGTQARIDAYEKMADLLWRKQDPTKDDFTAARDQYVIPEGLESRLARREDLHVDPIPMADWDPQVDADKQCTVEANVSKYPARCIGPSTLAPIIDDAFAKGQLGEGDPNVHAARIHGALVWFLTLSIYKEANTCATAKAEDCDSAWAYYTGGESIEGGLGIAAEVRALSPNTHERVHDGIMAMRCWRDLTKDGMGNYPLLDMLTPEQQDLFEQGWEQVDQSLHRALAVIVRGHMEAFFDAACEGAARDAEWAFLSAVGPGLQLEADARDATGAAVLKALWANDAPTAADIAEGVTALDAIFPCP